MPAGPVPLLARELVAVQQIEPFFMREQWIAERDALDRVGQLRTSGLVVDASRVCAQEFE